MPLSVYARTLLKAAELLGGRKKLSKHLQAPLSDLEKWIAGQAVPPTPVFLKAVDVVLDETAAPGEAPADPAPGKECASSCDGAWLY